MARLFDDAQNEYLEYAGAVRTASPFTVAAWVRPDSTAVNHCIFCIGDDNVDNHFYVLYLRDDPDIDLRLLVQAGGASSTAATTNKYTANNWHHCVQIERAPNSRTVVLDADFANEGNDAIERLPSVDTTSIGARVENGHDLYASGRIAWPAIWNVALSDEEVASLAAGTHPTRIRPADLVAFWPLGGLDGEHDRDIWGGYDMTAVNGPTWTDHPGGLVYPAAPQLVIPSAVAPSGHAGPLVNSIRLKSKLKGLAA